jgi:integrase
LTEAIKIARESPVRFPSPLDGTKSIATHALTRAITRAQGKDGSLCGIKGVSPYTCRMTVATWLGNAGHFDQSIGLLLSHMSAKTRSVTGRFYNHATYLKQKREMLDQ